MGVLLVVGIRETGFREILGVWQAATESEATWSAVFGALRARGLKGVQCVVSDAHQGLRSAIDRHVQGARWQRCIETNEEWLDRRYLRMDLEAGETAAGVAAEKAA